MRHKRQQCRGSLLPRPLENFLECFVVFRQPNQILIMLGEKEEKVNLTIFLLQPDANKVVRSGVVPQMKVIVMLLFLF